MESLLQLDHNLFFFLNGMAAWEPLGIAAEALSDFGRYAVVLFAGLFLSVEGGALLRRHALALLLIVPLALILNLGLKHAVNRPRPMGYYREAVAQGTVTIVDLEPITRRSFPSGHSMLAFFALGYLALARRRHAAWALALAAGVAWSRVAVGAHFPSDCLAGGAIGMACAGLGWRMKKHLDKEQWTTRIERRMPTGPSSGACSGC